MCDIPGCPSGKGATLVVSKLRPESWRSSKRPAGQNLPFRGKGAGMAISQGKPRRPEGPKELSKAVQPTGGTRNELP